MLTNDTAYVGFGYEPDYEKWKGNWREIHPGEISLCITPNFHLSGNSTIFTNLRNGMTIVVHPEFDIEAVVRDVIKYKVTRMMMVPAVLRILLDRAKEGADLSSLQVITYGASPIPLETMREATEVLGCGFVQMYGMTELGSTITYLEPEDHDPRGLNPKMASAGRPAEEFKCKIVDPETREELPRGQAGEIAIWSPAPMKGYYKQPEATREVLDEDGWYYSGDVGIMDEDGYVYIQDRLKDMIVTGGENVYSAEVESALFKHPDVKDVAVFGIPSEKWGEAVHAHVVKEPGSDLTAEELIAYAREQIAGYKVPKSIEFVDELPRNASGKLLKHVMREPYWKDQKRRVG
jgi:acyl-CoA synthetase (AMP-forming)/AMP-acid ligase II